MSGENFVLGKDCKLYYGETLTATPTGAEDWTEIDNAKDVNLQLDNGEADITTRGNSGWKATAATLKEASIETEMLWKPSDPAFAAVLDAWLNNKELAIAAMSGAMAVAGSQGLAGNCVVTSFKRNEPLEEAVTVSVTLKPSSFTTWLVMPAGTIAATGTVTLSGQPGDANIVVIGDGVSTVTFEFDSAADPGAVEAGHTRVKIGVAASNTITALIDAINASALTIGAAEGTGDSADLTHQTLGVIGNVAITKTGANIAVTGMAGGV